MKKSATTSTLLEKTPTQTATKKRSSITDEDDEKTKRLKRTKSDCEDLSNEDKTPSQENFSLNQFYLETFLCILASALNYHRCLFNENELHLFQTFQTLSGASNSFLSPRHVLSSSVITDPFRSSADASMQMASTSEDQLRNTRSHRTCRSFDPTGEIRFLAR